MYRAFADLAEGYGLWERFQYRQTWDKLKTAHKALEMASVWSGPAGLKSLLAVVKQNTGFLEKLVLDPGAVKETQPLDLLPHAWCRGDNPFGPKLLEIPDPPPLLPVDLKKPGRQQPLDHEVFKDWIEQLG